MRKTLNSFQFQFIAVILMVAAGLSSRVVVVFQSTNTLAQSQQFTKIANEQHATAQAIEVLAFQLFAFEAESTREALRDELQTQLTQFENTQQRLRGGDTELKLEPTTDPELIKILDRLDTNWNATLPILERFIAADRAVQQPILEELDGSIDLLVETVTALTEVTDTIAIDQLDVLRQFIAVNPFVVLVVGGAAVFIVIRAVRSLSHLEKLAYQFAGGDFSVRAEFKAIREVEVIANAFNTMAYHLNTLIDSLGQQVDEAHEARERAEKSDQVKSAFLASMSHELRTPLNAIINYTKFVTKGVMGEVNAEQVDTLERVVSSAKHLLNLINDVLDMSKIESGSLNLFVEEDIDLNEILDNVVATGESLAIDKPITINTEIDPALPRIIGDRQRILQVMLNMVSNACKFTHEGSVTIRARQRDDDQIEMSVTDTGPGIAPEDYAAVFEPFQQGDTGLRQGGGTGLGMPISKNLVEAHGGRLWLESTIDKGTTFYVTLPIRSAELAAIAL